LRSSFQNTVVILQSSRVIFQKIFSARSFLAYFEKYWPHSCWR